MFWGQLGSIDIYLFARCACSRLQEDIFCHVVQYAARARRIENAPSSLTAAASAEEDAVRCYRA